MKIAIIGSANFDSLEFHLHDEITRQGNDARIFDYRRVLPSKVDRALSLVSMAYVEKKNQNLLEQILDWNPELVIGVYRHISPNVVRGIKRKGIKIIHINPDQLSTLQNQQIFVEPYDVYYSKDPYMVNFMQNNLQLNVKLYSEAFNPRIHRRPSVDSQILESSIGIDVLCFGNLYPYRNRMLRLLMNRGVNLAIYGKRGKYFDEELNSHFMKKEIFGEEKSTLLNGAKIVFNNFHFAEVESVNNKFFEISGSGGFQLCDYKPVLNKLLPIDPSLVSYKNIDEAYNLISYYLDKPEKRYEIRDIIMNYFAENYTYRHLVDYLLK